MVVMMVAMTVTVTASVYMCVRHEKAPTVLFSMELIIYTIINHSDTHTDCQHI